jgi:chromosome segregation ATPase
LELLKKLEDLKEKELSDQSIIEKYKNLENNYNELLLVIKNKELNIMNLSNSLEKEQINSIDLLKANKLLQSRLNEAGKQRSQVFDEMERICKEFEEKNKTSEIEIKNVSEKLELKNKQYNIIKNELDRTNIELNENISNVERLKLELKSKSQEKIELIDSKILELEAKIIEKEQKIIEKEEKFVRKISLDKDLLTELQNTNKKLKDLEMTSEENTILKNNITRLESQLNLAINEINNLKQKLEKDNIDLNNLIKKPVNTKMMEIRLADMNFNDKQNLKIEEAAKKQEKEMKILTSKFEEEHTELVRVTRRAQLLQEELTEAEAEILRERSAKNKSERQRTELARKLEELDKELEHSINAQAVLNDTRIRSDNEINKFKTRE